MELTGTIKKIYEEKTFSSGFNKRDLVLTTQEQYPQFILVEFIKEKAALLNSVNEGDDVTISINIRGREWTGQDGQVKYFNSITGWRIQKSNEGVGKESMPEAPKYKPKDFDKDQDDDDDLPF